MNYGEIKKTDIANGEGVRVSLFVSGCTHCCKGCFNSETWDFSYGKPFTEDTEKEIICALNNDFVNGLTLLGGEPFEPSNQQALTPFLKKIKEQFPSKNIWCYTGYLFDRELLNDSRARCDKTDEMLSYIDVLVDGEFVESLKNVSLAYKGSENQRIIDVKKSLETGQIEEWHIVSDRIKMK
ncbi:MAG: anaerobic ribonucleoside-triphosphate reductase activating protein [Clostridiales bacterium]|nr:anaerobic ribonucleoside-triphosphate reductase activating protein [Clostridiales bacterium]